MSVAILDRGLTVIEHLVLTRRPQRFSDLKQLFSNMTDATINRLLKALIDSGAVQKNAEGLYELTSRIESWTSQQGSGLSPMQVCQFSVIQLSKITQNSAAFAMSVGEHTEFAFTYNIPNSIAIAPKGFTLHYEADHAASLALLDMMTSKERNGAINSRSSLISSISEYKAAIREFKKDGYFADISKTRLGVSRIAVPINHKKLKGALFICVTTENLHQNEQILAKALKQQKALLLDSLNGIIPPKNNTGAGKAMSAASGQSLICA